MPYKQYMTTEYETQFAAVEELWWRPWVGKNYHKTKIFVVGTSTHKNNGEDWTKDKEHIDCQRNASRVLASWYQPGNEKLFEFNKNGSLFKKMAHIFTNDARLDQCTKTYAAFWQSVAFTNFYQVTVKSIGAIPERPIVDKSKRAFYETVKIIKPKLILVWNNDLNHFFPNRRVGAKKIGRVTPYVIEPFPFDLEVPIVGMGHPSRLDQNACINFLRTDPASKQPVEDFLQYLKQQPSN